MNTLLKDPKKRNPLVKNLEKRKKSHDSKEESHDSKEESNEEPVASDPTEPYVAPAVEPEPETEEVEDVPEATVGAGNTTDADTAFGEDISDADA